MTHKYVHQLHRIKGQLEGIERLVAKNAACEKVVMQTMAARASLSSMIKSFVEDEARACEKSGNAQNSCKRIKALAATLVRYT